MRGQPLTLHERERIEFYLRGKVPIRLMAAYLKRDHSVIVRELQRNRCRDGTYRAGTAHERTEKRRKRKQKRKLDTDDVLRNYVIQKLQEDWSPEQIVLRLKSRPPFGVHGRISVEAIYQWIYEGEGRRMGLYQYLPKGKRKRTRRASRKARKHKGILYITPIRFRPESLGPEDWESDTIVSRKGRSALSVQAAPEFMLTRIWKVEDKSAEATEGALEQTIESVPEKMVGSVTFDRGTEGANHWKLRLQGIDTYHCDPYRSWQKGFIENTNGLIRRYFPKSTNFDLIPAYAIKAVEEKLNNRPRKKLGGLTPNEAFEAYCRGVVY